AAALKRLIGSKLGPKTFGLAFLNKNPQLLKLWEEAVDATLKSNRKAPNALKRLLEKLEKGGVPTGPELSEAFGVVNSKFLKAARSAGHHIAEVHHWNYPKIDNLDNL